MVPIFKVRWVSYKQHKIGLCFLTHSANLVLWLESWDHGCLELLLKDVCGSSPLSRWGSLGITLPWHFKSLQGYVLPSPEEASQGSPARKTYPIYRQQLLGYPPLLLLGTHMKTKLHTCYIWVVKPRFTLCIFFSWWFRLRAPRVQVSWVCWSSCGFRLPSGTTILPHMLLIICLYSSFVVLNYICNYYSDVKCLSTFWEQGL